MSDDDFSPDPYANLPEDPELAFLHLEKHYRAECERQIEMSGQQSRHDVFYVDYMAEVLGAIQELELTANFHDRVPNIEDVDYNTYLNFNKDVRHFRTILEDWHRRRAQGYSVQFDTVAKTKIRHHLEQLRAIFDKLEIEDRKREDLFAKLNDLQQEVDTDRSHFDRLGAFMVSASSVIGESVEKSRILDIINAIASVFSAARGTPKQLQAPAKPKRIEPPKVKPRRDDMDDEIPF